LRIFDGGVAVITGGASGIGRALSHELAQRGCEVVIADLQEELALATADEIQSRGGKASVRRVDVRHYDDMAAVVKDTFSRCGRLDFFFNNAGIGVGGDTHLHTVETWDRIIDINLKGVVYGVQAVYPLMRSQGFGHIVNTASAAGLIPVPGVAAYTATKHAVVGLSKSLRLEASAAGVRVSALCPGVIRTPILQGGGVLGRIHGFSQTAMDKVIRFMRPMDPGEFARQALNGVARNRCIIVVPRWWNILWWQHRLMPTQWQSAIDARIYRYIQRLR
jgi:NAD(P)-dependent dehydrogenase (short-subunit alcohol dehydrogenase family)